MSGSLPGERRGGRKKGTPNKRTSTHQLLAAKTGILPLEYMLLVLRDEKSPPEDRKWAAAVAAPYLHPRFHPKDPPRDAAESNALSSISDRDLARKIAHVLMRASESPD